ncbi:hypothetical protein [Streptomyces asiaticus]|uniref:hypothetical protein n=1 Tax=Streptomyces asiaticus TaxID=114695 RepID=UPI003802539E
MEVARLILMYVKAVIWPVTAVVVAWLLRRQVGTTVSRMTRLETPVGAVEFAAEAQVLRERAEEGASGGPVAEQQIGAVGFREAWAAVDASPIGALVTAWNALADRLNRALPPGTATPVTGSSRSGLVLRERMRVAGVPTQTISLFNGLRKLRNGAVHDGVPVTEAAARDFVTSCEILAREFAIPSADAADE